MEQQILIIFTLIIFCTIRYSGCKHTHKEDTKTYRRIYGTTDSRYPHFHVFSNGKCAEKTKNKRPHQPEISGSGRHGNSRSFGAIAGLFGLGEDETDPLLASSKHYTLGIPFHLGGTSMFPQVANYELTDFVFRMCDDGISYPITFDYFELEFPVHVPGHIKVNYNFTTTHDLIAPIEVHFEGYKGILGAFVKFPCVFGLGSCIYNDFCQIFRYGETGGCPHGFKRMNIPCECPYLRGTYVATALDYTVFLQGVPEIPGPSPGTDGSYFGRIRLKKDGETLTCAEATMVVRSI